MNFTSEPQYQALPSDAPAIDTEEDIPGEPLILDAQTKYTFFVLGCALLLPWNVIITAVPFFLSRLNDSPHFKLTFSSYLTTSSSICNFAFLAHATFRKRKIPPSRETRRMIISLIVLSTLLVLSTLFRVPTALFAAFALLNACAQSLCSSYLQEAVISVGSLFGAAAIQPIMAGQAAVAVAVSAVQVFSAAASLWGLSRQTIATYVSDGSVEERSALIFFSFSTIFLLFSALVHDRLVRKPIYKSIAKPLEDRLLQSMGSSTEENTALASPVTGSKALDQTRIIDLVKANITYQVAVSYIFLITLSVFPPITASIQPISPDIHPLLFSSVHFLVFGIGDLLGRYACSFPRLRIWSAQRLLILSLTRTIFVPLFLMCNVQRASGSTSPPTINSDFLYMCILLIFGISNGYVGSMCMISAPSVEHNPQLKGRTSDVDTIATITNFSLVGGILIGSTASFGVKAVICNCNPFTGSR